MTMAPPVAVRPGTNGALEESWGSGFEPPLGTNSANVAGEGDLHALHVVHGMAEAAPPVALEL